MAITRVRLSASTNGQAVSLATIPTTLHTSTTAASTSDEIHVWMVNSGASTVTVHYWHGATVVSSVYELPSMNGLHLICPGLFLASGLVAYGSLGSAGTVYAYGFVNRLTTGA